MAMLYSVVIYYCTNSIFYVDGNQILNNGIDNLVDAIFNHEYVLLLNMSLFVL